MPVFGSLDIVHITTADIKSADRRIAWSSVKVRKNAASALRQVFEYAVDEGYLDSNPSARYRTKRKKDDVQPSADPYTAAERDTLLAWISENASQTAHVYFMLAFYSGMRTGEMLALQWGDYDG